MKHEHPPRKNCPLCGVPMTMSNVKKGTMYKRGVYRYECSCGHQEAIFGDQQREDAIADGYFDDEFDVPQYPIDL